MGVTTVVYTRSATGDAAGLARQAELAAWWATEAGVPRYEAVAEVGAGSSILVGLEGVLARAEAGERIRLVVADPARIARSDSVWRTFAARAAAARMEIVCSRDGASLLALEGALLRACGPSGRRGARR